MKDGVKQHNMNAMWLRLVAMVASAILSQMAIDSAIAYEEIAVTEGGALTGKVPTPKVYNLTTLPDQIYCGRISDGRGWRLFQPFDVGEGGVFRQVVVYIESISRGETIRKGQTSPH